MFEQSAWGGYAVSALGGFQDLTGESSEQPGWTQQLTLL